MLTVYISSTTASDGQVHTTVYETQSAIPAPDGGGSTSPDDSNSSSNTGAIAGGVVGGVVGLALLGVLVWFLLRRAKERRLEKEFDGNFDPDRFARPSVGGGTLPQMGPAEEEDDGVGGRLGASAVGGGVVSPYALYQPTSPPQHSAGSPPPMSQRSHDGTTSSSGYTPYDPYMGPQIPFGAAATHGGASFQDPAHPGVVLGTKEREALRQRGHYNVANPDEPHDVLVHQDGGRVDEEPSSSSGRDEIPPTYDSLLG